MKNQLGLDPNEKLFSPEQVLGKGNLAKIEEQHERLPSDSKTWDTYQKKVAELDQHAAAFTRIRMAAGLSELWETLQEPEQEAKVERILATLPTGAKKSGRDQLAEDQQAAAEQRDVWNSAASRILWLANPERKKYDLYFAAPAAGDEAWRGWA